MENQELLQAMRDIVKSELAIQNDYIDSKFSQVDSRFSQIDSKFSQVDSKFELQKDYIDSKFLQVGTRINAMENRIYGEMGKFHQEIIEDIGKIDEKLSNNNSEISAQALVLKKHEKEIQELKRKVG